MPSTPPFLTRVLRWPLIAVGFVALGWAVEQWFVLMPRPGDTLAYLSTGQRLNDGLPMYATNDLGPGYAPVAIFSPPLIGALFRLIVLLPHAQEVWLAAMALALVVAAAFIIVRVPAAGLLALVLAPEIRLAIVVGNIDAVVIAGLLGTWWLLARGREREAGLLLGILASLKLTPAAIVWWALVTHHRRMVTWSLASAAVCALVAMLATEPLIYLRFVEVTVTNYGAAMGPASLGELGRTLGVPFAAWLPRVVLVGGLALVWALRSHPDVAWTVGVVAMVLGSPVAAWHAPALLLAGLAPLTRKTIPRSEGRGSDHARDPDDDRAGAAGEECRRLEVSSRPRGFVSLV